AAHLEPHCGGGWRLVTPERVDRRAIRREAHERDRWIPFRVRTRAHHERFTGLVVVSGGEADRRHAHALRRRRADAAAARTRRVEDGDAAVHHVRHPERVAGAERDREGEAQLAGPATLAAIALHEAAVLVIAQDALALPVQHEQVSLRIAREPRVLEL